MDPKNRNKRLIIILSALIISVVLNACSNPTATPTPEAPPPTLPEITFAAAPTRLCRSATQLRLHPQIKGVWPTDSTATWTLSAQGDATLLATGTWSPPHNELFIPFPEGAALLPGNYTLQLTLNQELLAQHTFETDAVFPAITRQTLALTPTGPEIYKLEQGTRHFYLRFSYAGTCQSTPLWATISFGEEIICTHQQVLNTAAGSGVVACYHEDSSPLESGTYRAELSLMGELQSGFSFEIGEKMLSTAGTAQTTSCEPLFTAAAITSAGEPILVQERFEWYTQAIYAGTRCQDLPRGSTWQSQWYRNGDIVYTSTGRLNNGDHTVWDSINGTEANPFLLAGTYSVTLDIADLPRLNAEFRMVGYTSPESTP